MPNISVEILPWNLFAFFLDHQDDLKENDLKQSEAKADALERVAALQSDVGEMLFTNKGVTGPIVLSSSSRINKLDDLEKLTEYKKIKVIIDLKPVLNEQELY